MATRAPGTEMRPMHAEEVDPEHGSGRRDALDPSRAATTVERPRPDTVAMQRNAHTDFQGRRVREAVDQVRGSQAASAAPLVSGEYAVVHIARPEYDQISPEQLRQLAVADYEQVHELLDAAGNDPQQMRKVTADLHSRIAKLQETAVQDKIQLAEAQRDLKAKADIAKDLGDAQKSKHSLQLATAVLAVLTLVGTAASVTMGVLFSIDRKTLDRITGLFTVIDHKSRGYPFGVTARINVLAQCLGEDPDSLTLVDTNDNAVTTNTVKGEGEWSLDSKEVLFKPQQGFKGNPTPQKFLVKSFDGSQSKTALIILTYDGDFSAPSLIVRPFKAGEAFALDLSKKPDDIADGMWFVGTDFAKFTFLQPAAAPSTGKTETTQLDVANEGQWTFDAQTKTVTFKPATVNGSVFSLAPTPVLFRVVPTDATDTRVREGAIVLLNQAVVVADQLFRAEPGATFTVRDFAASFGTAVPSSLKLVSNKVEVTSLVVANEGTWTIAADGVLSFAPLASLKTLPSPVMLTIADSSGRRSAPFKLTMIPFLPPELVTEIKLRSTALDIQGGQTVACDGATKALRGDFDVDVKTTKILGLAPLDNAMPTAAFTSTDGKGLTVTGEGVWSVDPTGAISFKFAPAPVRWPTPILFSVKDVKGNESNPGMIWIVSNDVSTVAKSLVDGTIIDDTAFWNSYENNLLARTITPRELLAANLLIENALALSIAPNDLRQISNVNRAATVTTIATAWAMQGAALTSLRTVTDVIDAAAVDAMPKFEPTRTNVSKLSYAVRLIRLQVIRDVVYKLIS